MRTAIALLLIGMMLSSGCATSSSQPANGQTTVEKPRNVKEWVLQNRTRKRAVAGVFIGAAAGALTAALRGDDVWTGAAAGAVAGALAGFIVGKQQDRVFAHRDLAVRQAQYDASQGYVARVESVRFDPREIRPGKTTTLYVRYVVLGPNPHETIRVKMFRGLKYGDDYIFGAGPNEFEVPKGGGIVEATMDVTMSEKAPRGTYDVEALIEDEAGRFPQAIGTSALYIVASTDPDRREAGAMAGR